MTGDLLAIEWAVRSVRGFSSDGTNRGDSPDRVVDRFAVAGLAAILSGVSYAELSARISVGIVSVRLRVFG
jgi:hypothetical protein